MPRELNAQTFGSAFVIGAFIASEAVASYLSHHPSSAAAWFLTNEVFRPFELARIDASPIRGLFGPASLAVGTALLLGTFVLRIFEQRLCVALIANLCFGFSIALGYVWVGATDVGRAASLRPMGVVHGHDFVMMSGLMVSSFIAFLVSHLSYLGQVVSDRRSRRP